MRNPTILQAQRDGISDFNPTDTLETVAKRMTTEQISTLVVTDDDGFFGWEYHIHRFIKRLWSVR